ncbi:MAG: protein kinase domain-containing protein [Phycisphaerales bacterium]
MSGTSPDRLRELFAVAAELNAIERKAYLDAKCADDPELRRELESLLSHHDPASRFMETPAIHDAAPTLAGGGADSHAVGTLPQGAVVAGYAIVRVLGAGGMGVVYAAEQASPKRLIALKLMRSGLVSRSALRRFEQEGAALARLKHAGIAQVFQAGSELRSGVLTPFLAMELIEGEPLGVYVARAKPSIDHRLALLIQVCDAVAHAHQRGVLHRDLKPANILVVPDQVQGPRTKILDFGIARLADDDSGVTATQPGMTPGTIAYMSPEQLGPDASAVDVRSDVYALGVVLYEMLTGRLPIDPTRLTLAEAARRVREIEPPRPGSIDRRLRGDLETIIGKALDKDAARRYQSASELADDIRRYLRHEPIAARPPTLGYVAGKFIRRHRLVVGAAAAIFLALGTGLAAALHQADKARKQLEVARQTSVLLEQIFSAVEPERALGREVTVREAIDAASQKLESSQIQSPEILASLHGAISRIYMALGETTTGLRHQQQALDFSRTAYGDDSSDTFERIASVGQMLYMLERYPEALELLRPAVERSTRRHGEGAVCTIRLLTAMANALGHVPEAVEVNRRVVAIVERSNGPDRSEMLYPLNNLAVSLIENGQLDEAEQVLDRCDALRHKILGPNHPDHLTTLQNYISLYDRKHDAVMLEQTVERHISEGDRILGPRHPHQVFNRFNGVMALHPIGRLERCVELMKINIPLAQTPDGRETPMSIQSRGVLAQMYINLKQFDLALATCDQTLAATQRLYGEDVEELGKAWSMYYDYYEATGDAVKQAEWREKVASTKVGRAALAAEQAQKDAAAKKAAKEQELKPVPSPPR